jgi:MFS family permease
LDILVGHAYRHVVVPRQKILVPVLVFVGLVAAAVASLGTPLVPMIAAADHVTLAAAQWSLTIALLVGAVVAPVMGRLGDGAGRRKVVLGAIGLVLAGCVLSALPLGFGWLLVGRALQGVGLGLVPLAIATARDALAPERSGAAIGLLSVTTAAGIGVGYPIAGLVAGAFGLGAAFWFGAVVSGGALAAAAVVLPPGPQRAARPLDVVGAVLLGASLTGLLLVLGQGGTWGWASTGVLGLAAASVVASVAWVRWELRVPLPLVDVRLVRIRAVLGADVLILLVGVGIYPVLSLVSRLVQTPTAAGYGFGSSAAVAGLALVPFSAASFVASKVAVAWVRRTSPTAVASASCAVLVVAMVTFLVARTTLWEIFVTMGVAGLGVGGVFASNPLQIVAAVPPHETGSAMGFNQVMRSVGFAAGSALSATVLAGYTPAGHAFPTAAGYGAAAVVSIGVLVATLAVSLAMAPRGAAPAGAATGAPPSARFDDATGRAHRR